MRKLEIPVKVYFAEIEELIHEIKRLQTYKLFEGDDLVLIDRDDVIKIFANHIKAKAFPAEDNNVPAIVHCSDCGYSFEVNGKLHCQRDSADDIGTDDFCSKGVRK